MSNKQQKGGGDVMATHGHYRMEEDDELYAAQKNLFAVGFEWCSTGQTIERYDISGVFLLKVDWDNKRLSWTGYDDEDELECDGTDDEVEYMSYDDLVHDVQVWAREAQRKEDKGWHVGVKLTTKTRCTTTKESGTMNETIAKLFEKTTDAMLVHKWYGHQIANNDVSYIQLNGKQKELLAAAKAKQEEADKKHEDSFC